LKKINAESLVDFEIGAESLLKVKIQYFGSIRMAAHKSEEKMEIASNSTVYQLLQGLVDLYGESFREEIFQESGEGLREDLMVTVNETIIKHVNTAEVNLKQADVIALYPLFPGGG